MRRKKIIGLFLLITLCAGSAFGQKLENKIEVRQLNFAGTWSFDMSRSKPDALEKEVFKEIKNYSFQLIIEQNFPLIKITSNEKFDGAEKYEVPDSYKTQIYFADGRGENEPIDTKVTTSQPVAKIVGAKLVITLYGLDDYNRKKAVATKEFSLSGDGNTLILESKRIPAVKFKSAAEEKEYEEIANSYLVFTRSR
jgi:hypothetical protein